MLISSILNLLVFFFFIIACLTFVNDMKKKGRDVKRDLRLASRYFTVQSNIFGAFVSLIVAISGFVCISSGFDVLPLFIVILKLIGTTGLMLTFLVVLFYLLPVFGLTDLFKGSNFYMHIVTPVLSLISFLFFDSSVKIPFPCFFLSLIPIGLYGYVYALRVVFTTSEEKRWDDMYMFNAKGKWYFTMILMFIISLAISAGILILHNILI